jgi:AAA15 family ATPase/GTPase
MYTRRKVFSVVNDEDEYYERLYSEAFDEGVDYAEKMFAEIEAERNYSDGFEDGYDYAIQRMYAWNNENEKKLYEKFLNGRTDKAAKREAADKVLAQRSKADKQAMKEIQGARRVAAAVTDPLEARKIAIDAIKSGDQNALIKAGMGQRRHILETDKALRLSKKEAEGLGKSLRNWKIGAGAAGAAGLAGLGYGIYKGTRSKDND